MTVLSQEECLDHMARFLPVIKGSGDGAVEAEIGPQINFDAAVDGRRVSIQRIEWGRKCRAEYG